MRYEEFAPPAALAAHVRCFWSFDSETNEPGPVEAIAPDGSPEAVFHLGDPFQRIDDAGRVITQHRAVLVGQIDRAFRVRPTGRATIFGVRFHPAGAAAFVADRAEAFARRSTSVEDLWGLGGRLLAEEVADAPDDAARARAVASFLVRRLSAPHGAALAAEAARRIAAAHGLVRIDDLAEGLGASPRTIERAFDASVGLAPKTLARIVRFRRALALLEGARRPPFAAAALDCGYADQSHLVRDFRDFTGAPPTAYLASDRPLAANF